jgi:hypothetical protein
MRNASGAGLAQPDPATSIDHRRTAQPDHANGTPRRTTPVLVAVGEYHPPTGRRHLGVVIVRTCPNCGHLHIHRAMVATTADGTTRVGSCGIEYLLCVLPAERLGGVA